MFKFQVWLNQGNPFIVLSESWLAQFVFSNPALCSVWRAMALDYLRLPSSISTGM
jgi:hypothetical protein